jgi:hypothetical protein
MASLSAYYPLPVVAGTTAGTYAEGNAPRIIDVTHAELLSLMGSQSLKTGFHYRITDFVTEYMSNDNEWISPSNTANVSNNSGTAFTVASIAATPEPLVVYAYSSSNVSKEAYSNLFPQDIIHYDPSLTYLDGTRTAKGFIVFRRDPVRDIECFYDWRNVRFKRWAIDPTAGDNPIPAMAVSTEYKIGDWAYHNNQIWMCREDHTMGGSIATENFAGMGFYQSSNDFIVLAEQGFIAGLGAGNSGKTGLRGGVGQAYYYPTFSNGAGTVFAPSQFGNIKITRRTSQTVLVSPSYSLNLPNIVLKQTTFQATVFHDINIVNSARITLSGTGTKNIINITDSNGFNFVNGTLVQSQMNYCNNVHVISSIQRANYSRLDLCLISHGTVINTTVSNCSNIIKTNRSVKTESCFNIVDSNNLADHIGLTTVGNGKRLPTKNKLNQLTVKDASIVPNFINLPVLKYVNEKNEQVIEPFYQDSELLHVQLNKGILDEIEGVADPVASLPLFSTQDHVAPSYTRNTSCWLNNYVEELTCISPWNTAYTNLFGCTAITPRHVLFAKHVTTPLAGATIRFITSDNEIVSRTILRTVVEANSDSNFDSGVALLNSDLPSTIHKPKLFPYSFARNVPYNLNTLIWWPLSGLFYVDQDKKAIIANWRSYFGSSNAGGVINLIRPFSPTDELYQLDDDENKYEFYEPIVTNDSGGPVFSILNGELVLMGALTLGAATPPEEGGLVGALYMRSGDYNGLIAQVDAAEGISTGYTIDYVDLSSFAKIS